MPRTRRIPDWVNWAALGALVLALAVLVVRSLPEASGPRGEEVDAAGDGGAEPWHDEALVDRDGKRIHGTRLPAPPEASSDLALLVVDTPDLAARTTREAIASRLDARHCGPACAAVAALVRDEQRFEVDRMTAEELVLPAKDTWGTVAATLTGEERASLERRTVALVIRTRGEGAPDHLPARAAFAVTLALGEELSALVYDETLRRIVSLREVAQQVVTAPLGAPVFMPRHVVVQLYRQDDGTARLLTLGMVRFGAPDVALRGASMTEAPSLANVLNGFAGKLAGGDRLAPLTVTLDDVAQVTSAPRSALARAPERTRPVVLDALEPPRTEGDPDNALVEMVPPPGETWSTVLATLFGASPQVLAGDLDAELLAIAKDARAALPAMLARHARGEGRVYVKAPFATPGDAGREWMWLDVRRCDARACTGILTNAPAAAVSYVEGETVTAARADIADALLRREDGTLEGGASIPVLEARASKSP